MIHNRKTMEIKRRRRNQRMRRRKKQLQVLLILLNSKSNINNWLTNSVDIVLTLSNICWQKISNPKQEPRHNSLTNVLTVSFWVKFLVVQAVEEEDPNSAKIQLHTSVQDTWTTTNTDIVTRHLRWSRLLVPNGLIDTAMICLFE